MALWITDECINCTNLAETQEQLQLKYESLMRNPPTPS